MKFTLLIDRDEDGAWIVSCPLVPACVGQVDTQEEAIADAEMVL